MIRIKNSKDVSLQKKNKEYIYLRRGGIFCWVPWLTELHLSEHDHTNLGPTVLVEWS